MLKVYHAKQSAASKKPLCSLDGILRIYEHFEAWTLLVAWTLNVSTDTDESIKTSNCSPKINKFGMEHDENE